MTGSRIRQTSFSNAAPVEVIGRKQFEESGVSTLAQAVQFLTVSQGTANVATVNLRGLGAGATLVLVNGRRMNPSGNAGVSADMSVIPLAAVERLEIMKAGAAAIYGADAVGGVVNVITRRAWSGFRGQIDGKTTHDGAFRETTGSLSFGAVTDRSRVLLASSYFRRGELTALERDALTFGKYVSNQGHPGSFLLPQEPNEMMRMMGRKAPPLWVPDPACGPASNTVSVPMGAGRACQDDYRPSVTLLPALERVNAFGSGDYDLSPHVSVFGEILFSRTRTQSTAGILGVLQPYPVVPADHVDNLFGVAVDWVGRPRGGREHTEPQTSTSADDSFRAVLGMKGELEGLAAGTFLSSWAWEAFTSIGVSRFTRTVHDSLRDALQDALNSCSDPADLSDCYNPFFSAFTGQGTANSQEVIDRIAGREHDIADQFLQTFNLGLDGALFALPGGDVGVAIGGEVRRESRATELDHALRQGRYGFLGGSSDQRARRNVYSAYVELRWPLLEGLELQTAARLERYSDINQTPVSPFAALIWEPARSFGVTESAPAFQRLQLRANVSRAFRAPTVFQTYPGRVTAATPLVRAGETVATWTQVTTSGNPNLRPETAYTVTGGLNWSPVEALTLAADFWYYNYRDRIQPEIAMQILSMWEATGGTMGLNDDRRVVYDPVTNSVGPIYVQNINVDGAVMTSGIDFGLNLTLGRVNAGPGQLTLAPSGTYTLSYSIPRRETVLRTFFNPATMMLGRLGPKGCSGSADVDLDAVGTNDRANDLDTCEVVGSRNANNIAPPLPRIKVNVPLTWNLLGHSASVVGHYIGSYDDDLQPGATGELSVIPAVVTFDLEYGYTLRQVIGERFSLRVGVENVFNRLPPRVNGATAAYDGDTHDPRGRVVFGKLSGDF